jgi:hypothetical protein
MGVDLRKPPQLAGSDHEQLKQLHSFVFQLVEQLEWALANVDTSNNTVVVTPTPKSLQSASQPKVSAEATFGSIKALIIKSADIVNAYYDEINSRLSSEYIAKSDFGTYLNQSSQSITQNSEYIEQLFSNLQQITTSIDNLNFTLAEVNAHIRSGKLYEDENGLPVVGLEIGQVATVDGTEVFNKFARFTADRLSFYDQNGVELAYISDYVLYISDVKIKGSLQEGGYKDYINANGGIVTKWVGGV